MYCGINLKYLLFLSEFKGIYIAYIYQKRDKRHYTKHQAMYLLSAAHKL